VLPRLDLFTGLAFEEVCQQYLWLSGLSGNLPFRPELDGRQVGYALCSRTGFSSQLLEDVQQRQDVLLFDLSTMIRMGRG
jgi:hypothetical protein